MRHLLEQSFVTIAFIVVLNMPGVCRGQTAAPLPEGVSAVWDIEKAYRQSTPTRERICINGLWLWQPADEDTNTLPTGRWGYFKVPECWPGINDYVQKDCQRVYAHPNWKDRSLRGITATGSMPLLERFGTPAEVFKAEKRWLKGLYMDVLQELNDPYRFFCWKRHNTRDKVDVHGNSQSYVQFKKLRPERINGC